MKKFIYSILMLAAGIAAVSCHSESVAPLASSVTVDKAEVTLAAISGTAKVSVTADGDWIAVAPKWVTINPKSGNSGTTEITVTATDNLDSWNEVAAPRSEVLYIFGDGEKAGMAEVALNQIGEAGLNSTRTYKKITKQEDFDPSVAYLLVFVTDEGALKVGKPLTLAPDDGSYAYMSVDDATAVDDVITYPNGGHGFSFVAEQGGYALLQSTGTYLYQAKTYANFYTTASQATSDVWSLEFCEDGTVKLTNTTNGDRATTDGTKVLHYSASYGNVEARDAATDGYPFLYKDSAQATDEVLSVDDVVVLASATSAVIPVTANKTWSVRNHDSWIKSFKKSAEGDAIEVTFDAYTSTTEPRTATFLVIGETTNVEVTLTQNKVATTVAEMLAQVSSTDQNNPSLFGGVLTTPAVVSYVNGNTAYIEDASGAIKMYKSGHGLVAGNTISGSFSGKAYIRSGVPQITDLDAGYTVGEGGTIPATVMTIADLLKNYDANMSRRIVLEGVTVSDGIASGDRNGKIEQGGKDIALYDESKKVVLEQGAKGTLVAFPSKYNANKQLSVWASSDFTAEEAPVPGGITIDGDFADWDGTEGATVGNHTVKVASDAKNIYLYSLRAKDDRYSEIWGGNGYVYIGIDSDNNMETGVELWGNGPYDFVGVFYPYEAEGTFKAQPGDACMPDNFTLANATCAGKVTDAGAAVEICIPRADILAIPATAISVYSWGNKGMNKVQLTATL